MPKVKFTSALKRFFPDLEPVDVSALKVTDVIKKVNDLHPGLADYLIEEDGSLRKHVNIFIGDDLITDRQTLSDAVAPQDEVVIFQALSGG